MTGAGHAPATEPFAIKAVNTWGLGLISTNREGTKRYFHFDGVGSTRALTDSSETVTDTYEYNAFGVLKASTGSSTNPFRYVGQYGYYDDGAMGSASGLLLLGVRYYSPAHGRFWSWDPVPNLNLYGYVENSATMWVDPSGLQRQGGVSRTVEACINFACAFLVGGSMITDLLGVARAGTEELIRKAEGILKKIDEDKTKQKELDDCIRRAMTNKKFWIRRLCEGFTRIEWPFMVCITSSHDYPECLSCCERTFRRDPDPRREDGCKRFCDHCQIRWNCWD
jgi:RHS repeat-associated protein